MSRNDCSDLDGRIMAAHVNRDWIGLISLYTQAGNLAEAEGHIDRACFFLTHAYVFSLEVGDDTAQALHLRLCAHGREQ